MSAQQSRILQPSSKDDEKPQTAFKTGVNEKPPHDHLPGREARGPEAASHKTPCSVLLKDQVLPVLM